MADISKIKEKSTQVEYNLKDATARTSISTIEGKIPSTASASNKLATQADIIDLGFYIDNDGDLCQN